MKKEYHRLEKRELQVDVSDYFGYQTDNSSRGSLVHCRDDCKVKYMEGVKPNHFEYEANASTDGIASRANGTLLHWAALKPLGNLQTNPVDILDIHGTTSTKTIDSQKSGTPGENCQNHAEDARTKLEGIRPRSIFDFAFSYFSSLLQGVACLGDDLMDSMDYGTDPRDILAWAYITLGITVLGLGANELWMYLNRPRSHHGRVLKVQNLRVSRRGRMHNAGSHYKVWCFVWILTCSHVEGHWRHIQNHSEDLHIPTDSNNRSPIQSLATLTPWWRIPKGTSNGNFDQTFQDYSRHEGMEEVQDYQGWRNSWDAGEDNEEIRRYQIRRNDTMETQEPKDEWEGASLMQTSRTPNRIVKLWAITWQHRFSLYWHSWSHIMGKPPDKLHIPDYAPTFYLFVDIQGKDGKEKIIHDYRIATPVHFVISCIESSHRGVLSWEHTARGKTPYAFVIRLCNDNDLAYDWTCWAENPEHTECGVDLEATPGAHITVYQRQLAEPTDSESTTIGTEDPEDVQENELSDQDSCSFFQRTFVGSSHEGLDWVTRDIPQGEWATRMEENFLADAQYLRNLVHIQPGHKHIRIIRPDDSPLWDTYTLSWEVQQASPLRMMRDLQNTWIDLRRNRAWTLTQVDYRPHLLERVAVHGDYIRVNAVTKKIQFPATKRSIIESSEVARCSQLYACEVWINGQRITHLESILETEPSLIQVVRTLGGETIPLLEGNSVPSIPVGYVRMFPLAEYRLLRHYGHQWHVILFRDTHRAEPANIKCDLQIHHQPETLVAMAFSYWPTLRIMDWTMIEADYAAYSSVVLNNYDAVNLIMELHAGPPDEVLLLLEKRTITENGEHAAVLAHRLFHEVHPHHISFALDAETQCESEEYRCEVYCNGNYIAQHEVHTASNGDFCTLEIEKVEQIRICHDSEGGNDEANRIRLRSRSPRAALPRNRQSGTTRTQHTHPDGRGHHREDVRERGTTTWDNVTRLYSELGWQHVPPPGNGSKVSFNTMEEWIFPEGHTISTSTTGLLSSNPFWVQAFSGENLLENTTDAPLERKLQQPPPQHGSTTKNWKYGNNFLDDFYDNWDREDNTMQNTFVRNYRQSMYDIQANKERWLHFTQTSTIPAGRVLWHPGGHYQVDSGDESVAMQDAGFQIFYRIYQGQPIYCVGDMSSEVVPVFFRQELDDSYISILYCSVQSSAEELVKNYFPQHTVKHNPMIWRAGQEVILQPNVRTPLALDELLPEPQATILDLTEVAQLHTNMRTPILPAKVFTEVIEWHPSTNSLIPELPVWTDDQSDLPDRYEFFTDGTARGKTHGAAAVVCLARSKGRWFWVGARAVEQPTDTTSNRMEASALLIALLWAHDQVTLHESRHTTTEIGFFYDSMVSGNVAAGIWTPQANKDLQETNRGLVHWLQERSPVKWIEWQHIPAHTGHPWNEAADTIAFAVSTGLIPAPPLHCFLNQIEPRTMVDWLWYWERIRWSPDLRFSSRGPKLLWRNNFEILKDKQHPIQQHLAPIETERNQDGDHVILKVGTANVLTFFFNEVKGNLPVESTSQQGWRA